MSNVTFNPALTTSPQGTFLQNTTGYVQGTAQSDPTSRMWLLSGLLDSDIDQPVWGGLPITEKVPALGASATGPQLDLATAPANITGFTVFDQGYNAIIAPGNSVPQYAAGGTANFYRLGSNARIPVLVDADVAAAIDGNAINTPVYWDFTANALTTVQPGSAAAIPVKVLSVASNSKTVSYNSGTGALTWVVGTCALIQI